MIAYEAYVAAAGGVSLINGQPLPSWDEVPENIQVCWVAAAQAILERCIP